jgi:DNA polymerase III delta subunit
MKIPELEALRARLAKGDPVPAVQVAGGDDAVREGAVEAVNEAFQAVASPVAIVRLDAEPAKSDAWTRVGDAAAAMPLFGEGTLAVVSGCDAAKVPEALKTVLASPPAHLRLVLIGEEKAKTGPLQKAVQAAHGEVVAPARIKDNQATALVAEAARGIGLALDSRAAAVLSFQPGNLDIRKLSTALYQKDRIGCATRGGQDRPGLRFSPHFYNTHADVEKAVAAVKKYMATGV